MRRDLPPYIRPKGPRDPKAPGGRKYLYFEKMRTRTPRASLYIVHREDGQPLGYDMAQKDIMAVRRAIGAEAYDIHSLRYAAASEIAALPGMTAEHVRAITGHTGQRMATHYSMKAGQRARAKEVQEKRK